MSALSPSAESSNHCSLLRHSKVLLQTPELVIIFALVAFFSLFLYHSSSFGPFPVSYTKHHNSSVNGTMDLKSILKMAATSNNTVIITTLNDAWAEPNSVFDLFLESFRTGNQTQKLLNHLVVVAWDQKAYARCLKLHPHCYYLSTDGVDFSEEAYYMAPDYLNMMWRRTNFLRNVVDLGYNFLFTDADIMWFRDPFPHFHEDGDFQIACDYFNGNPIDLNNLPNGVLGMALNNTQTKTNSSAFRSMLEKHQLTGPNFNKWFRALKLVVRIEKLQDVFETALPPAPAARADSEFVLCWLFYDYKLQSNVVS
uniref:Putative nucleotide-diphospho-sugar transferase, nucleotide-diphospho-sugar transferase n=1 Tax=Tanacetum cinerariifolium TaxID=118510 RepID=A0A6L2M713_TANCI|nr:putative nucleotide-diphospho-sugar transferase, nucleotide-diphospho-sugar transferase [Tanacetum cinerariifolium]